MQPLPFNIPKVPRLEYYTGYIGLILRVAQYKAEFSAVIFHPFLHQLKKTQAAYRPAVSMRSSYIHRSPSDVLMSRDRRLRRRPSVFIEPILVHGILRLVVPICAFNI